MLQPDYHPQRTIIVDDDHVESPETLTLRLEEEARAGDLGGCPPGLLPMSAYKAQSQLHGRSPDT